MADVEAKAALAVVRREAPTASFDAQLARAMAWHKWTLEYAAAWSAHGWADTTIPAEEAEETVARRRHDELAQQDQAGRERTTLSHEAWEGRHVTSCRRCGRSAPKDAAHKPFLKEACRGSAAGRAAAAVSGNINMVWQHFLATTRSLVEKGAVLIIRSHVPEAMVDRDKLLETAGTWADVIVRPAPTEDMGQEERDDLVYPADQRGERDVAQRGVAVLPAAVELGPSGAHEMRRVRRRVDDEAGTEARLAGSAGATAAVPAARVAITRRRPEAEPAREAAPAAEMARNVRPRRGQASATASGPLAARRPREDSGGDGGPRTRRSRTTAAASSAPAHDLSQDDAAMRHHFTVTGPLTWCSRCARYAHLRVGRGFTTSQCLPLRGGATQRRLDFLNAGLHPLTGEPLT